MHSSLLFAATLLASILLLQSPWRTEATFVLAPIALPAALTVAQLGALAGVGLLGKAAGLAGGLLLGGALGRGSRRHHGYRRGRRAADGPDEVDLTMDMLSDMEPEQCYRRIICAVNTGQYKNQKLEGILQLLNDQIKRDSVHNKSSKFLESAKYGQEYQDVAKCQELYQCSLNLEIISAVTDQL